MKTATVVTVLTASALVIAPQASASDKTFVSRLDSNGITYKSKPDIILVGKGICHDLRGMAADVPAQIRRIMMAQYSPLEAQIIIYAAGSEMCPDILPLLDDFSGSDNEEKADENAT